MPTAEFTADFWKRADIPEANFFMEGDAGLVRQGDNGIGVVKAFVNQRRQEFFV